MASIPLIRGDKVDNNTDYRDALPVNYYAVLREIYGEKGYFLNYYGLTEVMQVTGKSRGGIWVSRAGLEGEYRVSGDRLIKINSNNTFDDLGLISGSEQVSMTYSLNNIAIVADKKLYYYNPTDGLRQITSNDVVGDIIDIVWADFRFIATDGEYLYQSSILDEEVFEELEFSGSDFQPDGIKGVGLTVDNEVASFNSRTTEYFFNSGGSEFAYTRIPNKAIKTGIIGTHTKSEYKDKWFCLTREVNSQPQFSIIQSGSSESITTREIEKVLSSYTDDQLSTTVIETFNKDATVWMVAHLPDLTLKFNFTIAKSLGIKYAWSILKTDTLGDATYRGKDVVYNPEYSQWNIGDKLDSTLGFLDDSVCTHYENIVEGLLYTPSIDLTGLSIDSVKIHTIPGISPNNDATVFISRSDDLRVDGNEWLQAYGSNLDYNKNFEIRRLGYVRKALSFRLRTASSSRMSFVKFDIEAS